MTISFLANFIINYYDNDDYKLLCTFSGFLTLSRILKRKKKKTSLKDYKTPSVYNRNNISGKNLFTGRKN